MELERLKEDARRHGCVIDVPEFETTPEAVEDSARLAMERANSPRTVGAGARTGIRASFRDRRVVLRTP